MTLKKISEIADVSISTVSRALANSPSISLAVRDKILAIAEEIGYLDKLNHKGASQIMLRSILLVMPRQIIVKDTENWVSFPLIDQLRSDCKDQNIQIFSIVSGKDKINISDIKAALKKHNVNAIIIVQDDNPRLIAHLKNLDIPVVLINGEDTSMSVDTVSISNRFASMAATQYLLDLGHKRIIHLTWQGRITIARRSDGYKDALYANDLMVDNGLIIYSNNYTSIAAREVMSSWLEQFPDLKGASAIFCASDQLAIGAIEALKQHNLSVPSDVSVLGFDDMLPFGIYDPPLSTVYAPFLSLPKEALGILKERIKNSNRPVVRIELGCQLKERASVVAYKA